MREPPSPRTPWSRRYGPAVGVGFCGLVLLTATALMLRYREQADAILVHLVRHGRTYGPAHYVFYLCLLTAVGLLLTGLAAWSLLAVPRSEQRLDRPLSGQRDKLTARNNRALD